MIEELFPGHPGVAPGIIGRHAPLVAPEDVHPAPVHLVFEWRAGQKFVGALGGAPSRKRDAEPAVVFYSLVCLVQEKLRGGPAHGFMIGINADYSGGSFVTRHIARSSRHCK